MTALIVILAVAVTVAALVTAAAWLDRPERALRWADARLAGWLSPPPGDHHRFAAPDALPLDPVLRDAARVAMTLPPPGEQVSPAGRGQSGPGGAPVPPEEATSTPPAAMWPGAGPASVPPVQGAGRHPVKIAFPDGNIAILDARGRWRIKPLTWDGRLTGEQPALVPGSYGAFEKWEDKAVNVP